MLISKGHISRPNINDFPKPEIVRGEVINVLIRSIDGAMLLTVRDEYGNLYDEVQMIVNSPSSIDTKIKLPVHEGMEVVLLKTSLTDPVYVIGSIYNDPYSNLSRTVEASTNEQDRATTSSGDYRIDNGGNTFNMSNGYGFIFDTNNGFKFQMPTNGVFRISAGTNADDIVINHGDLTDFLCEKSTGYLTQMNNKLKKLEELHTKTETLMNDLNILITTLQTYATAQATLTGQPTAGPLAPLNAGYSALNAAITTLSAQNVINKTALETVDTEYANLPLKSISNALLEMVNSGNPLVRLPKN